MFTIDSMAQMDICYEKKMVLGYEAPGTIIKIRVMVRHLKLGDHVVIELVECSARNR